MLDKLSIIINWLLILRNGFLVCMAVSYTVKSVRIKFYIGKLGFSYIHIAPSPLHSRTKTRSIRLTFNCSCWNVLVTSNRTANENNNNNGQCFLSWPWTIYRQPFTGTIIIGKSTNLIHNKNSIGFSLNWNSNWEIDQWFSCYVEQLIAKFKPNMIIKFIELKWVLKFAYSY